LLSKEWEIIKFNDSYQIINLIFGVIILMVFIYSGIFRSQDSFPITSQYKLITGESTQSTGLSRAFSEILRFNFREAKNYNEYSWEVFAFFLLQLLMRVIFFFSYSHIRNKRLMIRFDAIGSTILFLLCFRDLILSMYS
jgi:hypothetical protein